MVFLLPIQRPSLYWRAFIAGLIVSTVHMVVVFPAEGAGMFAKNLGAFGTSVIVYVTDGAWSFVTAWWFEWNLLRPSSPFAQWTAKSPRSDSAINNHHSAAISFDDG